MKKSLWIILIICFIFIQVAFITYSHINNKQTTISGDYIAVFKGESGEKVNSTYLYGQKKGKKKIYKYINTESTSYGYDSTSWEEDITKKGVLKNRKQIFEIAKKNNAYSYVRYEDGKIYSIEEFKGMFH